MSSTGRGSGRLPHDFYATPSWCVHRFLERVNLPSGLWFDPCAGDGAIIRAAQDRRTGVNWCASERRAECEPALRTLVGDRLRIADYFRLSLRTVRPQVILTNPPYSFAFEFVQKALREAPHVAMLLRLNFLGTEKRAKFFQGTAADVYVLPNRPSFAKGQTDSCEYAWFVWGPDRDRAIGRVSVLDTTPKRVRIEARLLRAAA